MSSSLSPRTSLSQSNSIECNDYHLSPRRGRLIALQTCAEAHAQIQTTEAYIVEIPLQSANTILKIVDGAIRDSNHINLQHLRRFVKPEHLPNSLKHHAQHAAQTSLDTDLSLLSTPIDIHINSPILDQNTSTHHAPSHRPEETHPSILYFLASAASVISHQSLYSLLSTTDLFLASKLKPHLRIISVPLFPPTSEEQANGWSQSYWPTRYKGNNPQGPHPPIVARAAVEMQNHAGEFMGLARRAGLETALALKGEPIGAVIVDRTQSEEPAIAVAAGDARWEGIIGHTRQGPGNVTTHAVMRAVAIVAKKRKALSDEQQAAATTSGIPDSFADEPLTLLEKDVYQRSILAAGGYLCLNLEIYLTHEPCVMCCMAILHSRFSRVVFGQRMTRTGGLTADGKTDCDTYTGGVSEGLGYGLFWRPQLNWKFLTWQWVDHDRSQTTLIDEDIHA